MTPNDIKKIATALHLKQWGELTPEDKQRIIDEKFVGEVDLRDGSTKKQEDIINEYIRGEK